MPIIQVMIVCVCSFPVPYTLLARSSMYLFTTAVRRLRLLLPLLAGGLSSRSQFGIVVVYRRTERIYVLAVGRL